MSLHLIPVLNTNIIQTTWNKTTNWHFLPDIRSSAPRPQFGVEIIGEFEDEVMSLPLESGNFGGLVDLLQWGVNIPLLLKLPSCFPFMSVAPNLSTPAQILHSGCLVSIQHHSRSAASSQLWTAEHKTSINTKVYVQLTSSASGRCHTDWSLCSVWAGVNCWFEGYFTSVKAGIWEVA